MNLPQALTQRRYYRVVTIGVLYLMTAENPRADDKRICAGLRDIRNVVFFDSTIHLKPNGLTTGIVYLSRFAHLI